MTKIFVQAVLHDLVILEDCDIHLMDDRLKEILMTLRSVSSLMVFVEIANAKC